jgi:hypothetical protein
LLLLIKNHFVSEFIEEKYIIKIGRKWLCENKPEREIEND